MSCVGRDCAPRGRPSAFVNVDLFHSADFQTSLTALVQKEIETSSFAEKINYALAELATMKMKEHSGRADDTDTDNVTNALTDLTSRVEEAETLFQKLTPKYASLQDILTKQTKNIDALHRDFKVISSKTPRVELASTPQGEQIGEDKISKQTRLEETQKDVLLLKSELEQMRIEVEEMRSPLQQFLTTSDEKIPSPTDEGVATDEGVDLEQMLIEVKVMRSQQSLERLQGTSDKHCSSLTGEGIDQSLHEDLPLPSADKPEQPSDIEYVMNAADKGEEHRADAPPEHHTSHHFKPGAPSHKMHDLHANSVACLDKMQEAVLDAYEFQDSINDLMLFLGICHYGVVQECLVIFCFSMNVAMQAFVCYIITEPVFSGSPFDDDTLKSMHIWRVSDAHSNAYADPERSSSLVSRVCNFDPSLTLATSQQQIFQDISDYNSYGGLILSLIAMTFFATSCAAEIRQCLDFLVAFWCLPRASHTIVAVDGTQCKFESLSCSRLCFCVVLFLCRMSVALFLGYNGCVWLAYTDAITDLLLNSAALNFVLMTPDLIFEAFVPAAFFKTIRNFEPIEIPHRVYQAQVIPYLLLLGTIAFILMVYIILLRPLVHSMTEVTDILCGGNLDFVYSLDYVHQVFWTRTESFGQHTPRQHAIRHIVKGIVDSDAKRVGNLTIYEGQPSIFNNRAKLSGAAYVSYYKSLGCSDTSFGDKKLGMELWALSGLSKYNASLASCSDVYTSYPLVCHEVSKVGTYMRFSCPHTCGCGSATSGLGELGVERLGCPVTACANSVMRSLRNFPCNDTPLEVLKTNWSYGWNRVAHLREHTSSILQQPLVDYGCPGLLMIDNHDAKHLCHYPFGASTFCPRMCNCTQRITEQIQGIRRVCPGACHSN